MSRIQTNILIQTNKHKQKQKKCGCSAICFLFVFRCCFFRVKRFISQSLKCLQHLREIWYRYLCVRLLYIQRVIRLKALHLRKRSKLLRTINKPKSFHEADANKRAIHRRGGRAVSRLANLFRHATASLAPNHRRESSQNHYEIHRRMHMGRVAGERLITATVSMRRDLRERQRLR